MKSFIMPIKSPGLLLLLMLLLLSLIVACTSRPSAGAEQGDYRVRSEEHTSELQSRPHLVCRLLLEKKKLTHPHAIDAFSAAYQANYMSMVPTAQNTLA